MQQGEHGAGRYRLDGGITVVHDVGRHDGQLFIVMELLRGEDLARVIARSPKGLPAPRRCG